MNDDRTCFTLMSKSVGLRLLLACMIFPGLLFTAEAQQQDPTLPFEWAKNQRNGFNAVAHAADYLAQGLNNLALEKQVREDLERLKPQLDAILAGRHPLDGVLVEMPCYKDAITNQRVFLPPKYIGVGSNRKVAYCSNWQKAALNAPPPSGAVKDSDRSFFVWHAPGEKQKFFTILLAPDCDDSTFTYPDGRVYTGKLNQSVPDGLGAIEFPNGDRVEGLFRVGMPIAQGVRIYANGDYYQGDFNDAYKPAGQGGYVYKSGVAYRGMFRDGVPFGKGDLMMPDESHVTGNFTGSLEDGEFKVVFPPKKGFIGSILQGTMVAGKWEGPATLTFWDKARIDGTMTHGVLKGQFYRPDGSGPLPWPPPNFQGGIPSIPLVIPQGQPIPIGPNPWSGTITPGH